MLQREQRQVTRSEQHQNAINNHSGGGTNARRRREHMALDAEVVEKPLNSDQQGSEDLERNLC